MDFLELCKNRYSVRRYSEREVEQDKIDKILEAAKLAPTACNFQPQRIYVLKSEMAKEKLSSITRMSYGAPVVLLVCYDETISWKNTPETFGEYYEGGEMDATIAGTQMMNMATELGLGTLWSRGFDSKKVHDAFDLPANIRVSFILDVGYPAENSTNPHTKRNDVDTFVNVL